jgi:hypothetical protein
MAGSDQKQRTFNFNIQGGKGDYQIAFRLDDDEMDSTCTCSYQAAKKLCWHRNYILAGKTSKLTDEEIDNQALLISILSKTLGGQEMIKNARHIFGGRETCKRCNSVNVVDTKHSFWGKFMKLFITEDHRYFCKDCKWTW